MTRPASDDPLAITVAGFVERADIRLTHALCGERDDPVVRAAGEASEVADQPPLLVLSVAVLATGLLVESRTAARTGARMAAAHLIATGIKTAIKRSVDRTRPERALSAGYRMARGGSRTHALSSFPSGHTAGAVAVAQAVAREAPVLALPLRLFATSVALIQVPRGKHYVSDVVVGAAIGWIGERIASAAIDAIDRRVPVSDS